MALTDFGLSTFTQSGNSVWSVSAYGLDTLSIPMTGLYSALAAYENSLNALQWTPAAEDGNMFLATWSNDGHKQYPTVTLRYSGCRGGSVGRRTRTTSGRTLQAASYADSVLQIELSYLAFYATTTAITRTNAPIDPPIPSTLTQFYSGRAKVSGSDIGYSIGEMVAKFHPAIINPTQIETLVPGQYYSQSSSGQCVLLPNT